MISSVRAFVLAALLAPSIAVAAPPAPESPAPGDEFVATLAHVAAHFDLPVPHHPVLDRFLRWELHVRDMLHDATDQLASLAERSGVKIPDLSILTVDPVANTESSGFGWRDDPFRHNRRYHRGADFHAKAGTPVLCAGDGVVVFAGRQSGYGNVIYVDHGGGVVTRYAHLRRIETKKDTAVTAGERIGQVGSTGRATGPHLHFEIRLDGRAVDPVTAMTVAELERQSPEAGRLAAFALVPEIQAQVRDATEKSDHHREGRPERKGRVKRAQVLW
jgi:murein DD-endopeptidase MepM/ murein hydrolase activator NlpD